MFGKRTLTILIILFAALVISGGIYWFFLRREPTSLSEIPRQSVTTKDACLSENEITKYEIKRKKRNLGDVEANVEVAILDKETGIKKKSLQIENIFKTYYPIELHKCGVYVIKMFNYDPKKTKQAPGYRAEFWRYGYDGKGSTILVFQEVQGADIYMSDFATDFRVDPLEDYVALWRGYFASSDYSLVIKNLKTKTEDFALFYKDLLAQNKLLLGNIGFPLNAWTKDGNYFWGNIFDGANVLAFFRMDRNSWKYEIFPAPQVTMGGDAFNPDKGLVTYRTNAAPWTGDADFDQQFREEAQKQKKITSFYVYNLFTKTSILIATTSDPTYHFLPQWLSDTELQYELPGGEQKAYKIEK